MVCGYFNYTTSAMTLSICPISFYNEPSSKNLIRCENSIDNAAEFWYNQRDDKRALPPSPVSDEHKTRKTQKRVFCPCACRLPTAYVPGHPKKQKTCRFLKRNVYKHRKTRQMGLTNKKRYAIINTINYWYCFFTFAAFSALKWFCYSQMRDEKQRVMKSDIEIS